MNKFQMATIKAKNKVFNLMHGGIELKKPGFNELIVVCGLAIIAVVILLAAKGPLVQLFDDIVTTMSDKINNTLFSDATFGG